MKSVCMPKLLTGLPLSNTCQRILLSAFFVVFLVFVDQLSKHWMIGEFVPYHPYALTSFFNLTLAFNQGAAFSFLHDQSGWQRWFFIGFALFFIALFAYLICRPKQQPRIITIALCLIMAGAIGNVIDRVRYGYVIDFFDFHIKMWHWPVFNFADSAITIGILLYLSMSFLKQRP